jgi:poly(hydroxyalkanoate) depolymerase family esterase
MHRRSLLLGAAFVGSLSLCAQKAKDEVLDFGANPGQLRMFLRAPASNGPAASRSLVVLLHGCGQDAEGLARRSGWTALADSLGIWLLMPQQRFRNNPSRCFNWFAAGDITPGKGEAASLARMILKAADSLGIAPARTHLYGVSAGGAMAAVLMACYPDLFSTAVIIGGAPYGAALREPSARRPLADPQACTPEQWAQRVRGAGASAPERYPRLVVMHGTRDAVSGFDLGLALVAQWTTLSGTDSIPDAVERGYRGTPGVSRSEFRDAAEQPVVVLYRFEGMGHRLPSDGTAGGWLAKDVGSSSARLAAHEFGMLP